MEKLAAYLLVVVFFLPLPGNCQGRGGKLLLLDRAPSQNIVTAYTYYDNGGNTSIAFDDENSYKWSGQSPYPAEPYGYFRPDGTEVPYVKRDRDLGQTFRMEGGAKKQLRSITVRLGFGTNVVRPGMYGRKLSVQLFEVTGIPIVDDNGSDSTEQAFHGFPHNRYLEKLPHNRDDFIKGEQFRSIAVFRGFIFPAATAFGISGNPDSVDPSDPRLKGRFLQFQLPGKNAIILTPGSTYAFLIMIDEQAAAAGFTLANNYTGAYTWGHAIRRDGRGVFPPVPAHPLKDFTAPENRNALLAAHFPSKFRQRIRIPPGTNGYPDVDTWRDLVFYIEAN